jgi:peptidyl-prolyl cis-trans isomerase A (cyclophilin A)
MRFPFRLTAVCAVALLMALIAPGSLTPTLAAAKAGAKRAPGLYATIDTTAGPITARLYEKEAPHTVANFVGLASGKKTWTDSRTGKKTNKPLYNGTIFHRVVKGFMIQGGDPLGNGTGGPGYTFADEMPAGAQYDYTPGTLAMANSGPNTNGSQFFIMHGNYAGRLPKNYNIFGKVVDGMNVVDKIASAPVTTGNGGEPSKPEKPVVIRKITITRVGSGAK